MVFDNLLILERGVRVVFKRKPKSKVSVKPVVIPIGDRWNTAEQISWRQRYNLDRKRAVVEGRSCGKCIAGVVYFGPKGEDQTPCRLDGVDCEFTKKESAD